MSQSHPGYKINSQNLSTSPLQGTDANKLKQTVKLNGNVTLNGLNNGSAALLLPWPTANSDVTASPNPTFPSTTSTSNGVRDPPCTISPPPPLPPPPPSVTNKSTAVAPTTVTVNSATTNSIVSPPYSVNPIIDSTINAPNTSSVWFEQGEYFFDDEFAASFGHTSDEPAMDDGGPLNGMTQSCVYNTHRSTKSQPRFEQSRSDSCLFTPADSQESGLSGMNGNQLHSNSIGLNAISSSLHGANCKMTDFMCQQSINGSQGSDSTSWMQMLMERSCNPGLRALLNRTAAAVDYKLAYGDSIAFRRPMMSGDKSEDPVRPMGSDLGPMSRSFSQGSLLAAESLAGFRQALSQANQMLPKPSERPRDPVTLSKTTVATETEPALSSTTEIENSNTTTTWAKRHGSRESLKRKSAGCSDLTVFPPQHCTDNKINEHDEHGLRRNPWRAIKQANGAFITWNQLKRTMKRAESFGKSTSTRESRRDQHDHSQQQQQQHEHQARMGDDLSSSDRYLPSRHTEPRSQSQPLDMNHLYMHRFSGTLLEIFMRAKRADTGLLDSDYHHPHHNMPFHKSSTHHHRSNTIASAVDLHPNQSNEFQRIYPTNGALNARQCPVACGINMGKLVAERDKHPLLRGEKILPVKLQPGSFMSLSNSVDTTSRLVRNFGTQFPPLDYSNDGLLGLVDPAVSRPLIDPQLGHLTSRSPSATALMTANPYANVRRSYPHRAFPSSRPLSSNNQWYMPINTTTATTTATRMSSANTPCSPMASTDIAACLTASTGPDSPYLTALRAGCAAKGYAVGWIGNPRTAIAYPGLGLLSVPRPSRLTGAAFLSHTLPDLSFLSQAGAEEERKGTPTMSKRRASYTRTYDAMLCTCGRKDCRPLSGSRSLIRNGCPNGVCKLIQCKLKAVPQLGKVNSPDQSTENTDKEQTSQLVPDLVADHTTTTAASDTKNDVQSGESSESPKSETYYLAVRNFPSDLVDRSTSEPDLSAMPLESGLPTLRSSVDSGSPWTTATPYLGKSHKGPRRDWKSTQASPASELKWASGPKKSVSFSGNIRQLGRIHRLNSKDLDLNDDCSAPLSPELKVIPRNWGLYGQEQPLAEFNPRNSPGWDNDNSNEPNRHSDVDVRYHAMVNDVIKAVQETVAYYCQPNSSQSKDDLKSQASTDPLPYSRVAALGSMGRQPLLAVIAPLTVLVCDGLLPPPKQLFTSRIRTRLWQLVEESCKQNALPPGVAYHVLNDAVSQVKALTNITLEKTKFKAFICACLNAKALPMWLNALVANDALLRRFYCENAFVRQCRTGQRGLYADLMTHLEQLLAFPFNLDLAIEARKPLIDTTPQPHLLGTYHKSSTGSSGGPNSNNNNSSSTSSNTNNSLASPPTLPKHSSISGHLFSQNRITSRMINPPATVVTRRQLVPTTNTSSRYIPMPSSSSTTVIASTTNPGGSTGSTNNNLNSNLPTIHHYMPHHLPSQRPLGSRIQPTPKPVGSPTSLADEDSEDLSCTSNEVVARTQVKSTTRSVPRTSGPTSSRESSLSSPSNSQVRGRFKSALSTFRRSGSSASGSHSQAATTTTTTKSNRIPPTTTTKTASGAMNLSTSTASTSSRPSKPSVATAQPVASTQSKPPPRSSSAALAKAQDKPKPTVPTRR